MNTPLDSLHQLEDDLIGLETLLRTLEATMALNPLAADLALQLTHEHTVRLKAHFYDHWQILYPP